VNEASAPPRDVLRIADLTVARGGRAVVHSVSMDIPSGEVTTLLGANGAGKSSLVLAVGGLVKPSSGTISIGDENLVGRRPERVRRAGVAVVPEGRRLLRDLSVADNLQVATYMLARDEAKAGVAYALELFPELDKRLSIRARSLSGGEQQMLVLAQALVSKPRFMLIDELSLGLAPVIVQRLVPTVRRVAESGVGVLLIEQFAKVALGLATGAYIIKGGRIQYSGTAAELQDNPDLLESAYLLGGAELEAEGTAPVAAPPVQPVQPVEPVPTPPHAAPDTA
jgi:branched-chain amino acid transport system ATP-binding protein